MFEEKTGKGDLKMTAKLSSWNETATKQAILDFVAAVTA
jgi:hypothetical protein